MPPRPLRTALAALLLAGATAAAARPVGPLPALGPFLDPWRGVWAAARAAEPPREQTLAIPGLAGEVRVVVDDRRVPHVFAATEEDAYRALGWLVARDRLVQLHVQTLAASGRLTELAGARALPLDREMRGLGLTRAADARLRAMGDTSASARVLRAYADGVNAWIDHLDATDLPLEFKLLGARPERWEPINSVHMLNRMGYTLAAQAPELDVAAAAARVGRAAAEALFPVDQPIVEPIQPNGRSEPLVLVRQPPPPGAPDPSAARLVAAFDAVRDPAARAEARHAAPDERPHLASNNWAVAPARSASGHALLAGDPHLELTLPSIWYEAHLVVPGKLDVYGVTIPGLPGIVIGFNRDVAWTFTNTGADVMDFWAEEVDDDARPTRYRLDGAWRPIETRVETYRGRDGEIVAVDTLRFTHRGPLRRDSTFGGGRWVSMRWTVLEATDNLRAFRDASRATTARAFLDAMARDYRSPAQNMLVADRGGSIGIRSTGAYPIRAGDGSGLVVRDGRVRANDWQGTLPVERWPQAIDPAQGFLASANQQPIDPVATRDYWGGSYEAWRALEINLLLRRDSSVGVDDMRRFQTEPQSYRALMYARHFQQAAERVGARGGADAARLRDAAAFLAAWDFRYDTASTRPVLFETAMRHLADRTWDELVDPAAPTLPPNEELGLPARPRRVATPNGALLLALDSASVWWDDRRTAGRVESRDDVYAASLVAAWDELIARRGSPGSAEWRWARRQGHDVNHLLRLPALSRRHLVTPGGTGTLSPMFGAGTHGASWRMVVELGPEVRGWATYPGGQSGDPTSPGYTDRLPRWLAGDLDELRVPRTADALPAARRTATLRLTPPAR